MTSNSERRICATCVLPESPPDVVLDADGVCSVCRREAQRGSPAPLLETDFVRLVEKHRGKGAYDCLVMCSGGKDSTAALYYAVRRYRLRPLAFTFDHGFENPEALDNVRNAVEALGVDFLYFRSVEMKALFRRLVESGSPAVICHICSIWYMRLTFETAARYGTRLIIAGWTKGQARRDAAIGKGGAPDAPEYASMSRATGEFLATLKDDPRYRDLPRTMEEAVRQARKRYKKAVVLSPHWFLDSHPDEYVALIERELGWKQPALSYPHKSTNCLLNFLSVRNSLRDYGYTHYHVEMSKLVRQGLMTRDEALELLRFEAPEETLSEVERRLR